MKKVYGKIFTKKNKSGHLLSVACCLLAALVLSACATYTTPPMNDWANILAGATFGDMTPELMIAKKPLALGAGTKTIAVSSAKSEMQDLESRLYNTLRKPGIQVSIAGNEVIVLVVRSAFMNADTPDLSADGMDALSDIAEMLQRENNTYVEIAGYADEMSDQETAALWTRDMAMRVGLYFVDRGINPIRMFITGRGSARPIADQSDMGRQMNRRVEIKIVPIIK